MKFRHFIYAAASALIALAGCTEEDFGPAQVTLDGPASIELAQGGEEVTVSLTSTISWKLQGYEDEVKAWLTISPEEGNPSKGVQTIKIKALPNNDIDRVANIVFYGDIMNKAPLTISQKGAKGDGENVTVKEFIEKADASREYRLTGTVSGFSSKYCSFDLTDATGTIYVYSVTEESKSEYVNVIKNGGTVTIKGTYEFYASKQQHEVVNATIESFVPGETPDYNSAVAKTVAEFLAAKDTETYYKLTGVVENFDSQYNSFYLKDNTASVYVYSVANASDWSDKLKNGATIELVGKYFYYEHATDSSKNMEEIKDAYLLSVVPGETPDYNNAAAKTVADFIKAADTQTYYKLTGQITNYNKTQCRFDLTDETGSIYVYSVANMDDWSEKMSAGGKVVLAGKYTFYENPEDATKNKPEVIDAYIISFEAGELPPISVSHPLTSNVTWTLGNKSYDEKVIINGQEYAALKLGTSNVIGEATLTIPAAAKKLSFYAVAWNNKTAQIEIVSGDKVIKTITPVSNSGANNNSPYTFETLSDATDYYTVEISDVTSLTVRTVASKTRAILFGVNAE